MIVVDDDFRTADEGRDGGRSFFCGFAGSLPVIIGTGFNCYVLLTILPPTNLNLSRIFMCEGILLSGVMPVLAMLDGRGFLVPVVRRKTTPDVVVDVDIALPGRDEPLGVTSPDRDPVSFN